MKIVKSLLALFLTLFVLSGIANAQVLTTAVTGGKGNSALLISPNGLFPDGLNLFNGYVQYSRGLTDRFDGYAAYGNITALGQTQHYVGVGGNLNLVNSKAVCTPYDISWFNMVTVPVSRRTDASSVLWNSAIVVSFPIGPVTAYTGINGVIPIGDVAGGKLFTPGESLFNIPIGISKSVGRWTLFVEGDPGNNLKSFGVGILRMF